MKKMKRINPYFASVLSGVLLTLSFPPLPFFLTAFIAFVPILLLFSADESKRKYLYLYITFFIYHSGSNWWIGSWQADSDPYLTASSIVLAFVHPFFFMVPFGLFFIVKKRISTHAALWGFPVFWTLFEWAHGLGELSYPWLTIGYTQIYNIYWIQFVDITGVWGASLLIALVNVIILKSILLFTKLNGIKEFSQNQQGKVLLVSILLIFIIPIFYGLVRTSQFNHSELISQNKNLSVGIIQPAINPWRKWEMSVDEMIKLQMDIADSLLTNDNKPSLIIWNETAIPRHVNVSNKYTYFNLLSWADDRGVSLFTGVAEVQYFNSKNKTLTARRDSSQADLYFESFNSSILINPNQLGDAQSYQKMRLTPMAERLPYAEQLMFMRSWFEWGVGISSWGIGKKQKNLNVEVNNSTASLGPVICIESIYPEFVSNTVSNGAEFLVIITNDAWYDYTPGPEQHYVIAAMRAIENRRYIARCANTGVSGVLSPIGTSISRLPQYTKAGLTENIPLLKNLTLYAQFGDWLAYMILFATILFIASAYIKPSIFKK